MGNPDISIRWVATAREVVEFWVTFGRLGASSLGRTYRSMCVFLEGGGGKPDISIRSVAAAREVVEF